MPLLSSCGWTSAEPRLMSVMRMHVTCCLLLAGDVRCRSAWSCAASVGDQHLLQLLEEAPCELMAVEQRQRAGFYRNGVHCASGETGRGMELGGWLVWFPSLFFPAEFCRGKTRMLHVWGTIQFWVVIASPKPVIATISFCSRQFARCISPCDVLTLFTSPGRTLVTITFMFPTSRMSVLEAGNIRLWGCLDNYHLLLRILPAVCGKDISLCIQLWSRRLLSSASGH